MTNNRDVFRRVVATTLVLGLQCFTWTGAGVHAHLDADGSDHHDGRVVHAHAPAHTRAAPRHDDHAGDTDLHAPEDGAVLALDPFVAVETPASTDIALVGGVGTLPEPLRLTAKAPIAPAGGHDPPPLRQRPSRAPPLA